MNQRRTRLAPSPTGALHLGNAFSFLVNWAIARQSGWELLFRMEDLNGPRNKLETITQSVEILTWLGIDWDGDVILQSEGLHHSHAALETLIQKDLAYHCELSRREIVEVTAAPHHLSEHTIPTRPLNIQKHNQEKIPTTTNWRFVATVGEADVTDTYWPESTQTVNEDFVIWTKENSPAYQLAVVVDDHRQGVTDVIRGNDLYHSAALQSQLYKALGWDEPTWVHLPLILGADKKRLAKRHGDSRIETYKSRGVPQEKIIGLVAKWSGIQEINEPMNLSAFCKNLSLQAMKKENKIFSAEDEQWLLDS
ncbi:MAG: tRNA glutamyl-Q(34) synthetase GluQRS [Planctomycetes bacterium]|nr:tRNA glutamyl-Q(34) synthetase GluQRS [Planctomycetota bacterium]